MKYYSQPVNEKQIQSIDKIRKLATELDLLIQLECPKSREQSVSMTKLEECCMWAIKSITHNKEV